MLSSDLESKFCLLCSGMLTMGYLISASGIASQRSWAHPQSVLHALSGSCHLLRRCAQEPDQIILHSCSRMPLPLAFLGT